MWPFNKKNIDRSPDEQRNELLEFRGRGLGVEEILKGEDCDEISGAIGEFGRAITNPIPVNSPWGERRYLNRLLCSCGLGVFYHRLGSKESKNNKHSVDVFETVCFSGKHWDTLIFDFHHPRRSLKIPKEYAFTKFEDSVVFNFPFSYGATSYVEGFPEKLSEHIYNFDSQFGPGMSRSFDKLFEEFYHPSRKKTVSNKSKI
ncbi:hypothetical protein ACFL04_04565 [Patescibacteria group bacterium]